MSKLITSNEHVGKGWTVNREGFGKVKWFVVDCSCGWTTPLCALASRAKELFSKHREEKESAN
jgi:hypothetical protein